MKARRIHRVTTRCSVKAIRRISSTVVRHGRTLSVAVHRGLIDSDQVISIDHSTGMERRCPLRNIAHIFNPKNTKNININDNHISKSHLPQFTGGEKQCVETQYSIQFHKSSR